MRYIALIIKIFIRHFIYFVPRSDRLICISSIGGRFVDNSKYFYLYLTTQTDIQKQVYWITHSKQDAKKLKKCGVQAVYKHSFLGMYIMMRSKYWFYSYSVADISTLFYCGATRINLWHGMPIKKIEHDIKSGPLATLFQSPTVLQKFSTHTELFITPDYVVSNGPFFDQYIQSAFNIDETKVIKSIAPRNLVFSRLNNYTTFVAENYLKTELLGHSFKKVVLYMPTFRDGDKTFDPAIVSEINSMIECLQNKNILFLVKSHPATQLKSDALVENKHLRLIDVYEDVYDLMKFVDTLITDYSSVCFDFLLKEGAQIIFYDYDYDQYKVSHREVYYDLRELPFYLHADSLEEAVMLSLEMPSQTYQFPMYTVETIEALSALITRK